VYLWLHSRKGLFDWLYIKSDTETTAGIIGGYWPQAEAYAEGKFEILEVSMEKETISISLTLVDHRDIIEGGVCAES
jgi:hypothetical protein